ncbi:MAG: hypothetical protein OEU26_02425 [Candidatus Tectomicrobia bacterium]|nr:hypothetical protein [Candidatus Tectomicrobia bacterium]
MHIAIPYRALKRVLFWLWITVITAGLTVEVAFYGFGLDQDETWLALFSLSYEENVPTWYTVCLVLVAAWLLMLIAIGAQQRRAAYVFHWWGLAIGFFYISLDELVQLHEQASRLIEGTGGVLYFDWIIPATPVLIILILCYAKFLFHLPSVSRNRFILAGSIFVFGAIVMELPLGWWVDNFGDDNFGYSAIDFVEESLEMFAINFFILTLVKRIFGDSEQLRVSFHNTRVHAEAAPPESHALSSH